MDTLLTAVVTALVNHGLIVGLLVLIIVSGYKKLWVWGWQLREAQVREEKWELLFLRTLSVADKTTDIVVARKVDEPPRVK